MKKTALWLTALTVALTALPAMGCGSAEAAPLDVTYYYLPG